MADNVAITVNSIKSTYENGELTVNMKKLDAKQLQEAKDSKIRRIPISTAWETVEVNMVDIDRWAR